MLTSTNTNNNRTELATETRKKAFACSRLRPKTQKTIECREKCNGVSYDLEIQKGEISTTLMDALRNCNNAHAAASLDRNKSQNIAPTDAEKINAMPYNVHFCKTEITSMTCSYGDFSSRDTLCSSLLACEVTCVHVNIAETLAGTDRNSRIKARKAINRCTKSREGVTWQVNAP